MKKILTVIGARPQFIKCAPVSNEIRKRFREIIVHTGQHYDESMSDIFFEELAIPRPDYNLEVGSGLHGEQTGKMLMALEKVITEEAPDSVIVYGDTNSTLAGALAASKLLVPVFHIEAGLRSYNMKMPEEQNRIIADRLSSLLFCPTEQAVKNLKNENITSNVFNVGDVMYDSTIQNIAIAEGKSIILNKLNLERKKYMLATIHRAENTDYEGRLKGIASALNESDEKIVLPVHPRTRKYMKKYNVHVSENIIIIDPVGYFDMLVLEKYAKKIITDSGGIQKEAFFLNTPCIVIRDETEWTELIDIGANVLVGACKEKLSENIKMFNGNLKTGKNQMYGDGKSAQKICRLINEFYIYGKKGGY